MRVAPVELPVVPDQLGHLERARGDLLMACPVAELVGLPRVVDVDLARKIPERDDMVDALYNQVYRELLTYMISDPSTIDQATFLLWVAHNLERTADRVTNICERTLFVDTGELHEIKSSDDENTIDIE